MQREEIEGAEKKRKGKKKKKRGEERTKGVEKKRKEEGEEGGEKRRGGRRRRAPVCFLSFGFGSGFMVIDGRFQFEIQIEVVSELEMVAGWGGFGGGGRQESAEFKQVTKVKPRRKSK